VKSLISLKLTTILMATALVAACAQTKNFESSGVQFYKSVPSVLSSAWSDGQDTYLVPSRGSSLMSVSLENGQPLEISRSGSYVKVAGNHSQLEILVNGKNFQLIRN
jgi:hypothetical protein